MSAKSIFEADGKAILNYHLTRSPVIKASPLPAPTKHNAPPRLATLHFPEDADIDAVLDQAEATYPWLLQSGAKFVAKPDQLIKRRGKSGLLCLNKPWAEARAWVAQRAGKVQKVENTHGVLRHFLVEPFVPHKQEEEYYININSVRDVSLNPAFSMRTILGAEHNALASARFVSEFLERESKLGVWLFSNQTSCGSRRCAVCLVGDGLALCGVAGLFSHCCHASAQATGERRFSEIAATRNPAYRPLCSYANDFGVMEFKNKS
jgi:hypothetical protein